jgi:hypothetical protein
LWTTVGVLAWAGTLAGACGAEPSPSGNDLEDEADYRLGRIHVVVEPAFENDDVVEFEATAPFEVAARFAYFRGLDEGYVRARVDMPLLAEDVLEPGQCVPSDQLAVTDGGNDVDGEPRELVLVDAGDLSVRVGTARVDVPISLVPDLLPYMSGVEYLFETDLPAGVLADGTPIPVSVTAEGSQTDELASFTVEGDVPARLRLALPDVDPHALDEDVLTILWHPAGDQRDNVVVHLAGFVGGEAAGRDVVCVFPDEGRARLDLEVVRELGLGASGDLLEVAASRIDRTTFDTGEFIGCELVVEVGDRMVLRLP